MPDDHSSLGTLVDEFIAAGRYLRGSSPGTVRT